MLARHVKVRTLMYQREFIEEKLKEPQLNGNPSYSYEGYLYPENVAYFEQQGYTITTISSFETVEVSEGLPINIFVPIKDINLSADEIEESKEYAEELKTEFELEKLFGATFSEILEEELDGNGIY